MKTVKVVIHGRVQGVWFRATTKSQAEKQGVHGWVRNTDEIFDDFHVRYH